LLHAVPGRDFTGEGSPELAGSAVGGHVGDGEDAGKQEEAGAHPWVATAVSRWPEEAGPREQWPDGRWITTVAAAGGCAAGKVA